MNSAHSQLSTLDFILFFNSQDSSPLSCLLSFPVIMFYITLTVCSITFAHGLCDFIWLSSYVYVMFIWIDDVDSGCGGETLGSGLYLRVIRQLADCRLYCRLGKRNKGEQNEGCGSLRDRRHYLWYDSSLSFLFYLPTSHLHKCFLCGNQLLTVQERENITIWRNYYSILYYTMLYNTILYILNMTYNTMEEKYPWAERWFNSPCRS